MEVRVAAAPVGDLGERVGCEDVLQTRKVTLVRYANNIGAVIKITSEKEYLKPFTSKFKKYIISALN